MDEARESRNVSSGWPAAGQRPPPGLGSLQAGSDGSQMPPIPSRDVSFHAAALPSRADLQAVLDEVMAEVRPRLGEGAVASYIPELAKVDPQKFGIALTTLEGVTVSAGDCDEPFSIQSVSKVFTLTLALGRAGDGLWRRVGREPSGSPFNSIVQLEAEKGVPRNPLINAGAIVVADVLLAGREPKAALGEIVSYLRFLADDEDVVIDRAVAASETLTGERNRALAHFMKAFGNLSHDVDRVLGVYFHQCAVAMSCRQLARAGLFLADSGRDPLTGRNVVTRERARRVAALMMTCGHYDGSGDFAFRVGLPGKSGVGGGILCVAPGRGSIAVWSPALNEKGNSLAGSLALEAVARRTGWSVF
jgi:glutaminase